MCKRYLFCIFCSQYGLETALAATDAHSFAGFDILSFDGVDDIDRFAVSTDRVMGGASYATFGVRAARREGRPDFVRAVFEGVILGPRIKGHHEDEVLKLGPGGNLAQVLLGKSGDGGFEAAKERRTARDLQRNDPRRSSIRDGRQDARLVLEHGEWRSGVGAGSLGWASARTKPRDVFPRLPTMSGLVLRVKGDGRAYQVVCKAGQRQFGHVSGVEAEATYVCHLQPPAGKWVTVAAPFPSFLRVSRGKVWGEQRWEDVDRFDLGKGLNPNELSGLGFLLADGLDGPFSLEVQKVRAVRHIEGVTDEEEGVLVTAGLIAARQTVQSRNANARDADAGRPVQVAGNRPRIQVGGGLADQGCMGSPKRGTQGVPDDPIHTRHGGYHQDAGRQQSTSLLGRYEYGNWQDPLGAEDYCTLQCAPSMDIISTEKGVILHSPSVHGKSHILVLCICSPLPSGFILNLHHLGVWLRGKVPLLRLIRS